MRPYSLLLLAILLFTTACSQPSPAPTSAPTQVPSDTLTPTPAATATFTPTPTFTPTLTPTPTNTPLPSPTPTPKGYFASNLGFTITLPSGWALSSENAYQTTFNNPSDNLALVVSVIPEDAELDFPGLLDVLKQEYAQAFSSIEFEIQDDVTLGDGTVANRANFTMLSGAGNQQAELLIQALFAPQAGKSFLIQAVGLRAVMDRRQDTLGRIYDSIALESVLVYGVPRASALVQFGYDPLAQTLDPALSTSNAADYVGHLFSGLVKMAPSLQVEPDLAESWQISSDGAVYTFTLRGGLTFQDGSPLTAEDVAYSLERAADPATGSDTARTYLGDILGLQDKLDGEVDQISGLNVVDERTLAITLDGPKPYFLAKLTYPVAFVVDQDNVESGGKNWMFTPNASGPFGLKDYLEEDVIIFERNTNYYQPAKLEHVVYLLGRAGTSISYYEAGDVDIIGLDAATAKQVQEPSHEQNKEMLSATSFCTTMLMFDNTLPPMDDPKVRQAFAQAVDRDQLIKLLLEEMVPRADTIFPPGFPGYSDDLAVLPFDAAAAKQALAESTYAGELPEITLNTGGYGDQESPYLDALIDMWRTNLGVTVKVEYLDPENYSEAARKEHDHIVTFGWCADYADPQNFLDIVFHTDSEFNVSGYTNPAVDELLEQARTELDAASRLQLYQQAEALLLEDFAALPEWHGVSFILVKPYVKGYALTPIGAPLVQLISIEK